MSSFTSAYFRHMHTLNTRRLFTLAVISFTLAGCAATGPVYQPAPQPGADQALVYIYRPNNFALGGRDAYFYVDGINVADLSRDGYTWFHVPAGPHTLMQKWPVDVSTFGKLEKSVNWQPGQTYHYQFVTDVGSGGVSGVVVKWTFSEVSAETARQEMVDKKLQPAFGAAKLQAAR